jgi:type IV pilus assembly protein PilW
MKSMRHTAAKRTLAAFRTARGLSLIELMVALVIGVLLIGGAVTVYMQSRTTYRTNDVASRMQEVGRYALDVISPDVRLAGYWGLTNRPDSFTNGAGAVGSDCGANFTVNVALPIEGRDAEATGGSGYNLACPRAAGINKVTWADVLIVRRGTTDPTALENGRVQIQSNREAAALFSDGARPAGFGAGALSETHNLMVGAYYVGEGPTVNGIRQFSLRRQTLVGGAGGPKMQDDEIIAGVQDMQVQFGLDVNGDGTVERYVNPQDPIPAGARIATVQVWLLVVAEEHEIGFKDNHTYTYANASQTAAVFHDNRRRVLMSKTIQVRNAAT